MARSLQLPARGRGARQLPRLAVRGLVRAAAGAVRDGRGLERVPPADVRRRRRLHRTLAAGARPPARGRARRRARVRARAVSRRALDRPPARADLDPAAARPLRRRARASRWLAVAALASIPLSGQVHLALGAIPFVLAYAARPRPAAARVDRRGGGCGGRGRGLGALDRPAHPTARSPRSSATRPGLGDFLSRDPGAVRAVRLPRLARAARRARRPRGLVLFQHKVQLAPVCGCARARRPRSVPARTRREPARIRLSLAAHALARDVGCRSGCSRSRASASLRSSALAVACVETTQARSRLACGGRARARRRRPLGAALRPAERRRGQRRLRSSWPTRRPGRLLERPPLPPDAYAGTVYVYYSMQAPT